MKIDYVLRELDELHQVADFAYRWDDWSLDDICLRLGGRPKYWAKVLKQRGVTLLDADAAMAEEETP